MLYVVLTMCAILAFVVWLSYSAQSLSCLVSSLLVGGFFLLLAIGTPFFPGPLPTYLLLTTSTIVAHRIKLRRRWFATWCAGSVVAGFAILVLCYIPIYREHQRLVEQYPAEDLAHRLAYEPTIVADQPPPNAAIGKPTTRVTDQNQSEESKALQEFQVALNYSRMRQELREPVRPRALATLSRIHADFVADFIEQPSFGVGRMPNIIVVRERHLTMEIPAPIPQPTPFPQKSEVTSPGEAIADASKQPFAEFAPDAIQVGDHIVDAKNGPVSPQKSNSGPDPLRILNSESIEDFASLESFGYVDKDRRARGFQPHAFRRLPNDINGPESHVRWRLAKLELVSLLKHQPPAVYVSKNLPAMDELKQVPTRPLDEFETQSIIKLRQTEDIVVDTVHNEKRMLGALRAVDQCVLCHHVRYGTLLGAFSYRFYRDPSLPEPAPPEPPKPITFHIRFQSSKSAG